jgi:GNAT superfamily N-acetyltransferase
LLSARSGVSVPAGVRFLRILLTEAGLKLMKVEITNNASYPNGYADIPIAFEVRQILKVVPGPQVGEFYLDQHNLPAPYVKDYDGIRSEHPSTWATQFDISNWGFLAAHLEGQCVGRAVVVCKTPDLNILEERDDLAVLWDIRVAPLARGEGVGTALFRAAENWARVRGLRQLKVETQNINVAACRFYESVGCKLLKINPDAYPELPDEVQLLWYKDLEQASRRQ